MCNYDDKMLICMDCGVEFVFTAGEQLFFADKGLQNAPKRCKSCKARKNERIMTARRRHQPHTRSRIEAVVDCALCGVETTVPFKPTQGRPVYCRDCFLKMRASKGHAHAPSY
ncbi:MAG: zinc-ribbon domain containing protein [Blastocatellia bacterium]|nr:zinc-ribbon domain containing protein [Blastocatellia bacterium]